MKKKYKDAKQELSAGSSVFLTQNLLIGFLGLVFWSLVARTLAPQNFGVFTLAYALAMMLSAVTSPRLTAATIKHMAEYSAEGNEGKVKRVMLDSWLLTTALSTLVAAAVFLSSDAVADFYGIRELSDLVKTAALIIVFMHFHKTTTDVLVGLKEYSKAAAVSVLAYVFMIAAYAALFATGYETQSAMLSIVAAYAATSTIGAWLALSILKAPADSERMLKKLVFYSLPLVLTAFASLTWDMSSMIIGVFYSAQIVGFYAVALKINSYQTMIPRSFSPAFLNVMSWMRAEKKTEKLKKTFELGLVYLFLAGCALTALFYLFAKHAILLVGGQAYLPATQAAKVLAFFGALTLPSVVCSAVLLSHNKTKTIMNIAVVKFSLQLAGLVLLTPSMGIVGASLAIILGSLVSMIISIQFSKKMVSSQIRASRFLRISAPFALLPVSFFAPAGTLEIPFLSLLFLVYSLALVKMGLDKKDVEFLRTVKTGNKHFDKFLEKTVWVLSKTV